MRANKIQSKIPFGYTTLLSRLWKEGKLPEVTKGFYGGDLSNDRKASNYCTNEHIKLHSKGGATSLSNIALATYENNTLRGNNPLSDYFNKENFKQYCEQFEGLNVPYMKKGKTLIFNGDSYIKSLTQTVLEVLEKEKHLNLLV